VSTQSFLISDLSVTTSMLNQGSVSNMGVATQGEAKKLITLIPSHLAHEKYEFVFRGDPGPECEVCKVRSVCLTNLEIGVRYSVRQVKSAEHYCGLVGSKARVVEVEKSHPKISVDKQKCIPGASIRYSPIQCDWKFCRNYIYCVENGVPEGTKIRFEVEEGNVDCPRGFKLVFVQVSQ